MNLKMKHIAIFIFAFVMMISMTSPLNAAVGTIVNRSFAGNLFEANGKGPERDHTSCTYAIDGAPAWCIDAGINVVEGEGYAASEVLEDGGALSWLMYNSTQMGGTIDNQIIQAAVWRLTGNNVWSVGGEMAQVDTVIAQAQACNNGISGASATISVEGGNNKFSYVRGYGSYGTVYLSAPITFGNTGNATIAGAPAGTQFVNGDGVAVGGSVGNGTFRIMIPAQNVGGDIKIRVDASSNASAEGYGPALVWRKEGSQTLITPQRKQIGGQGSSVEFDLTAVGDLKLMKKDEWNEAVGNVQFHITGPHGFDSYVTINDKGVLELQDLRVGTYTITETNVGQNLYIDGGNMNVRVTVNSGRVYTYNGINQYKRGSAQLSKLDAYENKDPKGDSILEGAVYEIRAKEDIREGSTLIFEADETIISVRTDANGMTPIVKTIRSTIQSKNLDGLPVGKYYWIEIQPSKGFNINNEKVDFEIKNNVDLYTQYIDMDLKEQYEIPIKGKVKVWKMDNDNNNDEDKNDTDKNSAAGAELRLALISDPSEFYDVVINEDGEAEFVDEDFKARYPDKEFTVPYGLYEITELRASDSGKHTYYYIQPARVNVDVEAEIEPRILMDEPIPMYLKVIKIDKDKIGEDKVVKIAGAKFKIWDCAAGEFIKQQLYPTGETDIFETNENGYFYTPQRLYPGKYIVYETESPDGYYTDEEWRLPANTADYGVEGKGGIAVTIDKEALGLAGDAEYPEGGVDVGELVYEIEIGNTPLKGRIEIEKVGEKLTNVTEETVRITEDMTDEKHTPIYSLEGLEGVVYEIIAAENIMSPDGLEIYEPKGKVVDRITTDENGIATSKELHLGEYEIKEVVTPEGYIKDENIENVVLENADKTVAVKTTVKELNNIRQKLKISFKKEYTPVNYSNVKDLEKWAIFGVYTNEDLKNSEGNIIIRKDSLVDVIKIENEEEFVTSNIDLPAGRYYVRELATSHPYTASTEKREVVLTHVANDQEYITVELEGFTNDYDKATITLIKISTSTLGNVILDGDKIATEDQDAKIQQMLNDMKDMTEAQIKEYLKSQDVKYVAGAEYSVFLDEDCTEPLYVRVGETDEFVEAKLITNETGLIKIEGLPIGKYYLKETYAPPMYQLSEEVVEIVLTREQKDTTVYSALKNEAIVSEVFTKKDIFTGEAIANCIFEIRDLNGKVLLHSITDGEGRGYIPSDILENGKTYQYVEISAPDIYDLNTEPHEFEASYEYDEEKEKIVWTGEEIVVENRRKTINKLIVQKLDEKTEMLLEGCRFSIILIDEKGNPVLNPDGEKVYLVKDAVTDENGEFIVEKPYYGHYQFIEIEAPEGYEMKVDLEGMTFTIDENSPETIVYEVTNARQEPPSTGDIAVIALVGVAIVSVAGIVFVIIRNRKKKSRN